MSFLFIFTLFFSCFRFFSFSFFLFFFLLAFLFHSSRLFTFRQVKGSARDGRSRHRATNQSFRACEVNLATPQVAKINDSTTTKTTNQGQGFFFFSHFSSIEKKCGARVHGHSSSSTLSSHQMLARDDLWVQISTDDDRTYSWNRQERTSQWELPRGVRPGQVMSRDGSSCTSTC